jgi:RNA polymerase sigma-70 factor, ECF subfamily
MTRSSLCLTASVHAKICALSMEPNVALGGVSRMRAAVRRLAPSAAADVPADPRDLYAAAYGRLVQVLTLVAGSRAEAEDVVQEAFVRLVPRWSKISTYDDPEAWVRSVAFKILSNRFRRSRNAAAASRRASHAVQTSEVSGDSVDVGRALAALPIDQREVVVLHHLLDLPVAEIASSLGVPVGTVKSRLSRARVALAPLLREESPDHA